MAETAQHPCFCGGGSFGSLPATHTSDEHARAVWLEFTKIHRPETCKLISGIRHTPLEEYQFVELLKRGVPDHMPPSKAKSYYGYLYANHVLAQIPPEASRRGRLRDNDVA